MNTRKKILVSVLMILITAVMTFGQDRTIDQKRLNRDLKIMEGILDKLLRGKSSFWQFDGNTKGLYLDGFGIVFHTDRDALQGKSPHSGIRSSRVHK